MTTPQPPWSRVYNDIKISVAGAADAVLQQELYRCINDFFDQTNIWTEEVSLPVSPNLTIYEVTLTGKGRINRLMLVYDPANAGPDKRWVQGGITMTTPGILQITTAPSTATTWNVVLAKSVTDPTAVQNYPDIDAGAMWIVDKYRDAFVYGTLARLYLQPSKSYSNKESAGFNMRQYITQRGKARTDALKANVYGGQRWMYPQSFATTARKGWT